MMTKRELLRLLQDIPDDGIIAVYGHSDSNGYDDATDVQELQVFIEPCWNGKYHEVLPLPGNTEKGITIYCIC
jgi:hypothetical protein